MSSSLYYALYVRFIGKASFYSKRHRLATLLPSNRRWLIEVYIESVRCDGIDVLPQRTEQTRSLPLAARIFMCRVVVCPLHNRVRSKAAPSLLVSEAYVVDCLLNPCRKAFI